MGHATASLAGAARHAAYILKPAVIIKSNYKHISLALRATDDSFPYIHSSVAACHNKLLPAFNWLSCFCCPSVVLAMCAAEAEAVRSTFPARVPADPPKPAPPPHDNLPCSFHNGLIYFEKALLQLSALTYVLFVIIHAGEARAALSALWVATCSKAAQSKLCTSSDAVCLLKTLG